MEIKQKMRVGLEVGTSKVVAVIGELLPDGVVNVFGVGSCPSKGIQKGSITDLKAVVNAIQRAVEAAESMADCQIISVTLAITGEHIQSMNESGFVPISEGEVTQEDIDLAIHTARSVRMEEGLGLLHVIPQEYAVDKQGDIKDPLGLQGVRLKAQTHLIACHQDWLNNLKKAVERCKLKVDKIVFSGLASAYSVLTEDEKDLGVCLIDFGAGTMDVVVYMNGSLRFSKVIPYGGDRVTTDIAHAFNVSKTEAERIKITYGSAKRPPTHQPEKRFEVRDIGGQSSSMLSKDNLSFPVEGRYQELLTEVKKELERYRLDSVACVVITGGGAQVGDLQYCAENVFKKRVRIATPLNITGLTDYVNKPQYSTVVGLLQYSHLDEEDDGIESYSDAKNGVVKALWSGFKKIVNKVTSEF